MDAVIVAAGGGIRMRPLTEDTHKCLLPIGGRPLLEYSLKALKDNGINRITVVTGHHETKVRQVLAPWVDQFVTNPFYKITNNMASLWFAQSCIRDDFLYLHADLLYHPEILSRFISRPFSFASICVDEKSCFNGEEMKVGRTGDHLVLGKQLPAEEAFGEFIGIAAFKYDQFQVFQDVMTHILANEDYNAYFAQAISTVSRTKRVEVVTFSNIPWIEIDDTSDLENARIHTLAQIQAWNAS